MPVVPVVLAANLLDATSACAGNNRDIASLSNCTPILHGTC